MVYITGNHVTTYSTNIAVVGDGDIFFYLPTCHVKKKNWRLIDSESLELFDVLLFCFGFFFLFQSGTWPPQKSYDVHPHINILYALICVNVWSSIRSPWTKCTFHGLLFNAVSMSLASTLTVSNNIIAKALNGTGTLHQRCACWWPWKVETHRDMHHPNGPQNVSIILEITF